VRTELPISRLDVLCSPTGRQGALGAGIRCTSRATYLAFGPPPPTPRGPADGPRL